MSKKIKWGILSTAKIAREQVIPALQKSKNGEVVAIASRNQNTAQKFAKKLNIAKYYGSYKELLQDDDIDAIYNPLPNHLHIPFTIQAAKAGKHILCEKPIALNAKEAKKLLSLPKGILCMEAFMVRFHLQWKKVLDIIKEKKIGNVKAIQVFFSYYNNNKSNIRNNKSYGGGAMYDIGCYPMVIGKLIFGGIPEQVMGISDIDPKFKVDRLFSAIYDFGKGKHLSFSVSTQISPIQKVIIAGTEGSIEVQIPFNPNADEKSYIYLNNGKSLDGSNIKTITIPACDQYQLECEMLNAAIQKKGEIPYSIKDAIDNMEIIDATFKAAKLQRSVRLTKNL